MKNRLSYFTSIPTNEHTEDGLSALESLLQSEHGVDGRHPLATSSQDGFLSAEDKQKLDLIARTVLPAQVASGGIVVSGGGGGGDTTDVSKLATEITVAGELSSKLEYDGSGNLVYVGKAITGSATSAAVWQIRKILYDASGNPLTVQWANGNFNFINIWDNHSALSYS